MNPDAFLDASFRATIAFGILAMAALLLAALWLGQPQAAFWALVACGASYAAQLLFTHTNPTTGQPAYLFWAGCAMHLLALGAWLWGLFLLGRLVHAGDG